MIKVKYELDINVIKNIVPSNVTKCTKCIRYKPYIYNIRNGAKGVCTISRLDAPQSNICNILTLNSLNNIKNSIVFNNKECFLFCKYYEHFDEKIEFCKLFNTYVSNKLRCTQCIALFNGSYI